MHDNAAMIGCAAYYKYRAGYTDDLTLDAVPSCHYKKRKEYDYFIREGFDKNIRR